MGSTNLMPTTVRRAEAAWRQEYLGVEARIARETSAKVLLAGLGELRDRQDKLDEAFGRLVGAVSEAGGGPWEGGLDLTVEALTD